MGSERERASERERRQRGDFLREREKGGERGNRWGNRDEGSGEVVSKAKILVYEKGKLVEQFVLNPKDYDIDFEKPSEKLSTQEVETLLNAPSMASLQLATLNAALVQYAINPQYSIEQYHKKLLA